MLTHVDCRTGRMHDMYCVPRRAHAAGAMMLSDLAHSASVVPVDLGLAGPEFAVGCGYQQRDKVT
jgi:kynureninase